MQTSESPAYENDIYAPILGSAEGSAQSVVLEPGAYNPSAPMRQPMSAAPVVMVMAPSAMAPPRAYHQMGVAPGSYPMAGAPVVMAPAIGQPHLFVQPPPTAVVYTVAAENNENTRCDYCLIRLRNKLICWGIVSLFVFLIIMLSRIV